MSPRTMHPSCCILRDAGDRSQDTSDHDDVEAGAGAEGGAAAVASYGRDVRGACVEVSVAGALYKWTNYGKGWRWRWFSLRDGVLSYSKIRPRDGLPTPEAPDVRLIGHASSRLSRPQCAANADGRRRVASDPALKPIGVVHLKISAFRESKSDDRRFYIFSPTKTLHLRTKSKKDRVAWVEALVSARSIYSPRSLSEKISTTPNNISFTTERLRDRMRAEGLAEDLIKDCEKIMLAELSKYHRQLKLHYEDNFNLLGAFEQHLEEASAINETPFNDGQLQQINNESSFSEHGKYSEYNTTESSEDVEKHELDDMSGEDKNLFYDAKQSFGDNSDTFASEIDTKGHESITCKSNCSSVNVNRTNSKEDVYSCIERRTKLPEPLEEEKKVSLWSLIKDNVGKDLTRVCLPVYFNEPLSSLQKCCEELEYSNLLDEAYEYGKVGNSLMRILKVAAFAVSGYASSDGRPCKPFNPLLGETYEAEFPEKGYRFFSEKVSHHPMLIACHCEGKGWKFWGDTNLTSKFRGRSIQLDPVGVLTLEFDDGEVFQWRKVTTTIYNIIFGRLYCDHHGTMNIRGNRRYSCKLKFKEQTLLDRNPRQVHGHVEDANGAKFASLFGKWDDCLYYAKEDTIVKEMAFNKSENPLLWKRSQPPNDPTRYNLSSFAITLNEFTSGLEEKLPPTDSRLRPDQRYLENGEYEKANAEKLRLEKRQRMSSKLQENGWKPRWFERDTEDDTYRYIGGYWEAREQKKWHECPDIFGEFP